MDKYLKVIQDLSEKIRMLQDRKQIILDANSKKEQKETEYKNKINSLMLEINVSKKRKNYLMNKKTYQRSFYKKSILFGIKSSSSFLLLALGIPFIITHTFSISILPVLFSFLFVGTILGLVEFRYVSADFFRLTKGITLEETNESLQKLLNELEAIKEKILKNQKEMNQNQEILKEIEFTIQILDSQIVAYRKSRNELIEKLIGNLDFYIPSFDVPQIDIHKLMERKFIP